MTKRCGWTLLLLVLATALTQAAGAGQDRACPTVHEGPMAVFIEPTDAEFEALKEATGEDFYTVADDALYYRYQATKLLEEMAFPYCFSDQKRHHFMAAARRYTLDRACEGWCLYLFNGREAPLTTYPIELFTHRAYLEGGG